MQEAKRVAPPDPPDVALPRPGHPLLPGPQDCKVRSALAKWSRACGEGIKHPEPAAAVSSSPHAPRESFPKPPYS